MRWLGEPSGKRGRGKLFSDAAIELCLSIKCLFNQPLRQALGMVQSLLQLAKLYWTVPDFSTVCRRQKTLQVALKYRSSKQQINLLVDSTDIKFLGEGEWKRKKMGLSTAARGARFISGSMRRRWRYSHRSHQRRYW